jgi:hypothetical protein
MNTGGFWSKILVKNSQWRIILERIGTDEIPEKVMNTDGFWSEILVKDGDWKIILKRIGTDEIPKK